MRTLPLTRFGTFSGHPILTSASGLVRIGEIFYGVGDAESGLFSFTLEPPSGIPSGLRTHSIFLERLPDEPRLRKKVKPDLEALFRFRDRLCLIPSGSTIQRRRGAIFSPADGAVRIIDLSDLYLRLEQDIPMLNIEGAIADGQFIHLFQRGNGKHSRNAVIRLCQAAFESEVATANSVTRHSYFDATFTDLGTLQGCPLGYTDAAFGPDGSIWFLAAAEDTESTYADGKFLGAVLGRLTRSATLELTALSVPEKPEGLWIDPDGTLHIVTDADSAEIPSGYYRGRLPT